MPNKTKDISSEYLPNKAETCDEWFVRQVEIGLREADDPNTVWVSNEQVFRQVDERLSKMQDRFGQRKAS